MKVSSMFLLTAFLAIVANASDLDEIKGKKRLNESCDEGKKNAKEKSVIGTGDERIADKKRRTKNSPITETPTLATVSPLAALL